MLLALTLGWVGGCHRASKPSVVRIGHESDVMSLDPLGVSEASTHSILSNIFESLVTFDTDMRLVPALAVSWNTPDPKRWEIQLRPGVQFHDGSAFTAADVKYTLTRAKTDSSSGVAGQLWSLEDAVVVNDLSLILTTVRPDPLLMTRLTYVLIVPRRRNKQPNANPVGTGPYRFIQWQRGRFLEADAFDGYWGGRPQIDRVLFVPVEQGERCVQALREGRVDVLRDFPESSRGEVAALPDIRIVSRSGLASNYLWPDTRATLDGSKNPFADRRVRQAISLAIDRQKIVSELNGTGAPATQLVQKGVFGHVSGLPVLPFDPRRSRQLLAEAGYGAGFDATLAHSTAAWGIGAANLIREMLSQVGIRLKLQQMGWPEMVTAWKAGRLPFFLSGWRFENGDATSFLRDCLYTRDPEHGYGAYNAGFSDPLLDRLINENDQIFDEAKRLKHYEELMRHALDEMPLIPLYDRYNLYAVSKRIKWEPRLDARLLAAEMKLSSD